MRSAPVLFAFAGICGLVALHTVDLVVGPATAAKTRADASAVRYASIQRGNIEQTVTVTGALQPVKTIEVGSQLSGQLYRVYVDFNDTVRKDQPLAQLDPRTFAAKVDEAKAALEMAIAFVDIEQSKLDRAKIDLENAKGGSSVLAAKLESAQAVKAAAQKTLQRKLSLQGVVATQQVEDAQTDFTTRRAQEREAEIAMSLNSFSVQGGQADVRRIEAELRQAKMAVPEKEAILSAAQADLDRAVIRSPIDGVIVGRFVNEGQTLAVGLDVKPTFLVAHRLEDMEVRAQVDEADIGRISSGQRAYFAVDSYPGRRFEAEVRQIRKAPQTQQNVVTYTVILTTSNLDGALLPGMTAVVKIVVEHQEDVLKVPVAALRFQPRGAKPTEDRGRPGVWVRNAGGSLQRVPVTIASVGADQAALKDGELVEGSQVAVGELIRSTGTELFGIRFGS